jgi:succinyl-diaminopimelate desuccinylase
MFKKELLENEILEIIHGEEIIKIALELIRCNTVNPPGKYDAITEYIKEFLENLGLDVNICSVDNTPNIVAKYIGATPEIVLLLNGHTDVVPVDDATLQDWVVDPFQGGVINGNLYGRGSCDMKGALASILTAVKEVCKKDIKLKESFSVVFTADEECGAHKGMEGLVKSYPDYLRSKMAIAGEPSDMKIQRCFKGLYEVELTVKGKQSHSSKPQEGINAIEKMAKLLSHLSKHKFPGYHELLGVPTRNIQHIQGGQKGRYSVPHLCKAVVEFRTIPGVTIDDVVTQIEQIISELKREDRDFQANVSIMSGGRHPVECSSQAPVVELLKSATSKVLGKSSPEMGFLACGDIYFPIAEGLCESGVYYGPGSIDTCHMTNEYVECNKLLFAAQVYALCILHACHPLS